MKFNYLLFIFACFGFGCSSFQNKPIDKAVVQIKSDSVNVNRTPVGKTRYFLTGRIKTMEFDANQIRSSVPFSATVFKINTYLFDTQIHLHILDLNYFEISYMSQGGEVRKKLHFNRAHENKEIGFIVNRRPILEQPGIINYLRENNYSFSVTKSDRQESN